MAWLTNDFLFSSLNACLERGMKVEFILLYDSINWQPCALDFNVFIQKGGLFHIADPSIRFMHHKFCLIDDESVLTDSYNWTYSSFGFIFYRYLILMR